MIKFRTILFVFTLLMSSSVFAGPDETQDTATLMRPSMNTQETSSFPGFSVLLYLPLMDNAAWSSPMAQSQMTVTPSTTYTTVRAIQVTSYLSTNGTCLTSAASTNIDNGSGNPVTLTNGHAYVTTNASNSALSSVFTGLGVGHPFTFFDTKYQLLDNTLTPIGSSTCIAGTNSITTCTGAANCGWTSPQTWTP